MENPISVANFFIKKGLTEGKLLTNMQVVKLTYLAHGWTLGFTGTPLLNESAQAWKYGPVVPSVYDQFKSYGAGPVTQVAWQLTPQGGVSDYPLSDTSAVPLLERVWEVYRDFSGPQLSALTHQVNTPWYQVWYEQGGKDNREVPIPNPIIEQYYKELIAKNRQANAGK